MLNFHWLKIAEVTQERSSFEICKKIDFYTTLLSEKAEGVWDLFVFWNQGQDEICLL